MAAAIKARKPWERSTGPKSAEGKRRSASNARKLNPTQDQKPSLPAQVEQAGEVKEPTEVLQAVSSEPKQQGHGGFFSSPPQRLSLFHVMGKKRS